MGIAGRGLETVDFGFAVPALGLAAVDFAEVVVLGLAGALALAVLADLTVVVRFEVEAFRFGAARLMVMAAIGLAVDMVFAATVSAFAAVVMAFVAVFIAFMADDIVFADESALEAAAVILLAAVVTLVAAEVTPLAAIAGVVELLDAELRVERDVMLRVGRLAVLCEREVLLRVDREAGLRVVEEPLPAGLAAMPRIVIDLALLVVLAVDLGRLAVPPDALRLADLLRALLALRRVAARVVVLTGTDIPPS